MPIEPPILNQEMEIGILEKVISVIINKFDPEHIYPEEHLDGWIKENVVNPDSGWFELVEEAALDLVANADPGTELYDTMEARIWEVKGRPVEDEERYG